MNEEGKEGIRHSLSAYYMTGRHRAMRVTQVSFHWPYKGHT